MRRLVVGLAIGIATFAPSWASANDEQIAKALVEKLEARKKQGQLKGFNIDLKVDKGTVWMSGHVASPDQQQMALDVARRIDGVEAVVNDLQVKPGSAPTTTTTKSNEKKPASTSEARPTLFTRWFGSPAPSQTAKSDTSDQTTKSDQIAKSDYAAKSDHADKLAQRDISVRPAGHESAEAKTNTNEALIDALANRLNAHKESGVLRDFDINLSANQGIVTVSGDASSTEQRDVIIGTIRRTPGVSRVVNMLHVPTTNAASEDAPTGSEPSPVRSQKAVEPSPASGSAESSAPRPIARLVPQRRVERPVVPAAGDPSSSAGQSEVIPTAAPPALPAVQSPLRVAQPPQLATQLFQPVAQPTPAATPLTSVANQPTPAATQPTLAATQPTPAATQPTPAATQPAPVAAQPTPAPRLAAATVGGYTAIPVQMVPAPFTPGQASPLQPGPAHLAQRPLAFANSGGATMTSGMQAISPMPAHMPGAGIGTAPARFDHPNMPGHAWPSYAASPNYAAVTYPKQYSPAAWPYIGPFYPYPQVPLGWRKVMLQWDDGWWYLDFKDK